MLTISDEVKISLANQKPVIALESTIFTHGFPQPINFEMAKKVETIIREHQATPATIAIHNGEIKVGLKENELAELCERTDSIKASTREIAECLSQKKSAGTTVASTMCIAAKAGIRYFATGGIGGVHFGDDLDISHDLYALAKYPVAVIASGAKSILDIARTLEVLETLGVPVVSYQSDSFPTFYSNQSPWQSPLRLNSAQQLKSLIESHFQFHEKASGLLIANPIPVESEIPYTTIQPVIEEALQDAAEQKIKGKSITPFLLSKLNELTKGKTLESNLALVYNNAKLAAEIATS